MECHFKHWPEFSLVGLECLQHVGKFWVKRLCSWFIKSSGNLTVWLKINTSEQNNFLDYKHGHNILRIFDVLPNILFTTSEQSLDITNKLVYTICLTGCRTTFDSKTFKKFKKVEKFRIMLKLQEITT